MQHNYFNSKFNNFTTDRRTKSLFNINPNENHIQKKLNLLI